MAKLNSFPSGSVESGDYFIGATAKGKTKRITMSSVIAQTKDSVNTLDNFAVANTDNGYTLSWNSNTLSINGPSIEDAVLSVTAAAPLSVVNDSRNITIGLDYTGAQNFVNVAPALKSKLHQVKFLVGDKKLNQVSTVDIADLPFSNNQGTVKSIGIGDDNGATAYITESGVINIKGGNGVTTKTIGNDIIVEYLGKVGGTVNNVESLDETVILTSISPDGSTVSLRPAKIPLLKAGRYDFASVTVDGYGRVTKIEDQKNKIDARVARIEALESQLIQLQNESSTDTSN